MRDREQPHPPPSPQNEKPYTSVWRSRKILSHTSCTSYPKLRARCPQFLHKYP